MYTLLLIVKRRSLKDTPKMLQLKRSTLDKIEVKTLYLSNMEKSSICRCDLVKFINTADRHLISFSRPGGNLRVCVHCTDHHNEVKVTCTENVHTSIHSSSCFKNTRIQPLDICTQ